MATQIWNVGYDELAEDLWIQLDVCVRYRHECDIKVFTFIYVMHLVRLEFQKETQCKIYIGYTHMVLVSVSLLWRQGWHIHLLVMHESPVIQWVFDISQSFHMATQIWVNVGSGNGVLLDTPSHYRNQCWLVELSSRCSVAFKLMQW